MSHGRRTCSHKHVFRGEVDEMMQYSYMSWTQIRAGSAANVRLTPKSPSRLFLFTLDPTDGSRKKRRVEAICPPLFLAPTTVLQSAFTELCFIWSTKHTYTNVTHSLVATRGRNRVCDTLGVPPSYKRLRWGSFRKRYDPREMFACCRTRYTCDVKQGIPALFNKVYLCRLNKVYLYC